MNQEKKIEPLTKSELTLLFTRFKEIGDIVYRLSHVFGDLGDDAVELKRKVFENIRSAKINVSETLSSVEMHPNIKPRLYGVRYDSEKKTITIHLPLHIKVWKRVENVSGPPIKMWLLWDDKVKTGMELDMHEISKPLKIYPGTYDTSDSSGHFDSQNYLEVHIDNTNITTSRNGEVNGEGLETLFVTIPLEVKITAKNENIKYSYDGYKITIRPPDDSTEVVEWVP